MFVHYLCICARTSLRSNLSSTTYTPQVHSSSHPSSQSLLVFCQVPRDLIYVQCVTHDPEDGAGDGDGDGDGDKTEDGAGDTSTSPPLPTYAPNRPHQPNRATTTTNHPVTPTAPSLPFCGERRGGWHPAGASNRRSSGSSGGSQVVVALRVVTRAYDRPYAWRHAASLGVRQHDRRPHGSLFLPSRWKWRSWCVRSGPAQNRLAIADPAARRSGHGKQRRAGAV